MEKELKLKNQKCQHRNAVETTRMMEKKEDPTKTDENGGIKVLTVIQH